MDIKQKKHEYYLKKKEQWNKASKNWYQKNKVWYLAKLKQDRKDRPEFWKERKRKWYLKHHDKMLEYHRNRNRKIREEFISQLGAKCIICGEDNKRFLHLDRIKGGIHSRQPDWIRKNLKEFQILCANHHNEKTCYKEIIWKKRKIRFL